ncbi:MAG: YicC/YloC family endoribonuclease [Kiritimatiellia bacterium]
MKSMTGFGQALVDREGLRVQVEISSVNRKNLDSQISLPRGLSALESGCQTLIARSCSRGRIQVRVLMDRTVAASAWELNGEQAGALLEQTNRFAQAHNLKPIESVSELLRLPQVWSETEPDMDTGKLRPLVEEAMIGALKELVQMREREGAHLRQVLEGLLEECQGIVDGLTPLLPGAREALGTKLKQSVEELGELSSEMQSRVLQEIALYGEKTDVREEVDRLRGHCAGMREKLKETDPVGRALDFLCQELSREWNTLSVKASRADINQLGLRGKEVVEKIREQVQNVE